MPKYPCGTCNKSAASNSVPCILCGMYHHLTVTCLPWHNKDAIDAIATLCKDESVWACGKCKVVMTKVNLRFGELEKDMAGVKKEVKEIKEAQETAEKEREDIKKKQTELDSKFVSNTKNVQKSLSAELKHREEKKKNVLVMGIDESVSTAFNERINFDKDKLGELFINIGVTDEAVRVSRIGKKVEGKPRPMKVVMASEVVKESVLDKAKKLDRTKKVYIKPDLTQWQRDDDDDVKIEVDTLNRSTQVDENGPFHWAVAGPPGQLRKKKVKGVRPAMPRRTQRPSHDQATDANSLEGVERRPSRAEEEGADSS